MINPSFDGAPQGASPFAGMPSGQPPMPAFNMSVQIPEDEQLEVVTQAIKFKKSAVRHAQQKKQTMRRCYAYSKNKLEDGDLLPLPSTDGGDKDVKTRRPQIFMPVVRQNLKNLFSQLKLTIFPNDEDYFRVRSKTMAGAAFEDELTDALKYIFKEAMVSEKIGGCLWDTCWSGIFSAYPSLKQEKVWEWKIQPSMDGGFQYIPTETDSPPCLEVEAWNPIDFYIEPKAKSPEYAKWVYVSVIKRREVKDSNLYMNQDKLDGIASQTAQDRKNDGRILLDDLNELSSTFEDSEDSLQYDLFYFPYLKTSKREYRNMLVGIAGERVLIRFQPNTFPKGKNPVVFCGWMHEPRNPYPQGPAEDMMDLQRLINLLENFKIESMSRSSNQWVMSPNANVDNFNGVVGGIIVTENPTQDVVHIEGASQQTAVITNEIGVLKAEAQTVAGSQNPFQGSANLDFKKTATEMQLLQEQFISILREVIEHVTITGVQQVLERLMYLVADGYPAVVEVPVETPQGDSYVSVSLEPLKSGDYTIEMIGINPAQSKQAQVQGLMELLELAISNPQGLIVGEPVIKKIGQLQGIKNVDDILDQVKEKIGMMMGAPIGQEGMPADGMGAGEQPGMETVPQAVDPGAGQPQIA